MQLPFLDRKRELGRLRRAVGTRTAGTSLLVVYGRRRLGKSRLIQELLKKRRSVYFVGDARDGVLLRAALAREVGRLVPGFAKVVYPGWEELFDRLLTDAPAGMLLALDEFPDLVSASPELPSILQKRIDRPGNERLSIVLSGSSQRMMHGLVLDSNAPLYGRAREIVNIGPMAPRWLGRALSIRSAADTVEQYAVWGGVPRYWELAATHSGFWDAIEDLVLDPLGPLQGEPERLLLDDSTEVARAASILSTIGQGAHRLSEIAARLEVPSTSLSRPIQKLVDLGFVRREIPFGTPARDAKRSLYRIADPLLGFFYRFVQPNRSWLSTGKLKAVRHEIVRTWPTHFGPFWEHLAREATSRVRIAGHTWKPAARFWGKDAAGAQLEIDLVAESTSDPSIVLVGEAKLSARASEVRGMLRALESKASRCVALRGKKVTTCLWIHRLQGRAPDGHVLGPEDVMKWE